MGLEGMVVGGGDREGEREVWEFGCFGCKGRGIEEVESMGVGKRCVGCV